MADTRSRPTPSRVFVTPSPKRAKGNSARSPALSQETTPVKTSSASQVVKTPTTPRSTLKKTPPTDHAVLRSGQVAAVNPDEVYQDLEVSPVELRASATLTTGQCFHWRVVEADDTLPIAGGSAWGSHDASEWVGVLRTPGTGQPIVVSVKEVPETTLYRVLFAPMGVDVRKLLFDYFQLNDALEPLYDSWSRSDPKRLARIAKCIPGVRIIEQDPWECLVSFICSSNNNIPRITKMLAAIRRRYGEHLLTIGDEDFYSFPSFETLRSEATEADFREIGLGYRAKYLMETMETLYSLGGEPYLTSLRQTKDPAVVQEKLTQFCGVGRKVADCVALFSLRQGDAIPVDVHVWNIARRDYDKEGVLTDVKSLTPSIYRQVGDLFRTRFKEQAGWAHSLLFVAELPSFRALLPEDLLLEMEQFRELEQQRKEAAKEAKKERAKK